MKRNLMIIFLLFGAMIAFGCSNKASDQELAVELANTSTEVIVCDVEGMTCTGCETGVEMAVKKLDGVIKVDASFADGTAKVTLDPEKLTEQDIIEAINKTGYKAKKKEVGSGD